MTNCPHFDDSVCKYASAKAGILVRTTAPACVKCREHADFENPVTNSLAVSSMHSAGKLDIDKHSELLAATHKGVVIADGVGTELKKLVAWFRSPTKDCDCETRIQKMNRWGPDGCRIRRATILRWLRHSAYLAGMFYADTVGNLLLNRAIRVTERKVRK